MPDDYNVYKREVKGRDEEGRLILGEREKVGGPDSEAPEVARSPEEIQTLLEQMQNVMDEIDEPGSPDAQRQWARLNGIKETLNWVLGNSEGLPGDVGFDLANLQRAAEDDQDSD